MRKQRLNPKIKQIFLTAVFLLAIASLSYAAVPHLINYQGRLTNPSGVPLEGSYSLTFRIYDAETAGNLLWEETQNNVVIQKGIFSILLGSVTNLNLAFDKPYFLEIKVGEEVMSPRQRIASTGYAIKAENAEKADNATTVANVGVSVTPAANKLLPLDNNAKLPLSALKVYDTTIRFSVNTPYTVSHNLNTTKIILQIFVKESAGDSWKVGSYLEEPDDDKSWQGISIYDISNNSISFRIPGGICYSESNGNIKWVNGGYLRVVILALE